MRLQLWSYNYHPEPMGIAPVSRSWAQAMRDRGHEVEVIAAHPHYPEPRWGWRALPYREVRDGIPVTRLPLIPGRASGARRMIQELSYVASQTLAIPWLKTPDVLVAVSPSFPALLPAMLNARLRRIPWALWLKDILPEGAVATGFVPRDSALFRAAQRLERAAYRSASHIFVLSETFRRNLLDKGVPEKKVTRVYDPATRPIEPLPVPDADDRGAPRVICMGNIGRSQGLPAIVEAFEADEGLAAIGARLVLTGTGVEEAKVRAVISTERVEMMGLLSEDRLREELARASIGAVTQHYAGAEFNVPSKVMNYFAAGLPVVASVHPEGEVTHLLQASGAGWATSSADPAAFARQLHGALQDPEALRQRGEAGRRFASEIFTPQALARAFESKFERIVSRSGPRLTSQPLKGG
jgi:colanic acid biosynthesis glycosyl transferase WcaI